MNLLRIAVTFIGALGIWIGTGYVATQLFGEGYTMPGHVLRAITTAVLVALLLALVLRVWPIDIGLRPKPRQLKLLGIGALSFAVPCAIAGAVIISLALATLEFDSGKLWQFVVVLVLVLLFEAIPEELIFRGVIYSSLRAIAKPWVAIIIQALLFCGFGALIGAALTPDRLLLFFTMSIALGIIRAATGSVYTTIGFHAAFQMLTQAIFNEQWDVATLVDPELWFRDVAFFLAPMVIAPLAIGIGMFFWTRNRVRAAT